MRIVLRTLALGWPLLVASACEHETAAPHESDPPSAATRSSTQADGEPVLVELFTSQGCSSCPPADALIQRVAGDSGGPPVIVLAYHVDYWNALGWPDPFSDPRWTQRQHDYAEAVGSTQVYTPQLLFDGRDRRVGVSGDRTRAALTNASQQPNAVQLEVEAHIRGRTVEVEVAPTWRDGVEPSRAAVMVALTDGGHRTRVPRGENAGRTLAAEFVVRDLARACTMPARGDTSSCRARLSSRNIDDPSTMQVVAFAQDPSTWTVLGTAAASP